MPHFGPRVIGDKQYSEAARVEEAQAHVFGTRVTGFDPNAPVEAPAYSVSEIQVLLIENPALLPDLVTAEFARPEGPRKGALRALLKTAQDGKGTAETIERLATALAE